MKVGQLKLKVGQLVTHLCHNHFMLEPFAVGCIYFSHSRIVAYTLVIVAVTIVSYRNVAYTLVIVVVNTVSYHSTPGGSEQMSVSSPPTTQDAEGTSQVHNCR